MEGAGGLGEAHDGDNNTNRFRTRAAGFAAGVVFALGVLGVVAATTSGGGVLGGAAARLGAARRGGGGGDDGWLVPRADVPGAGAGAGGRQAMPAYLGDAPQGRSIVNKEGGLPVGREGHTHRASPLVSKSCPRILAENLWVWHRRKDTFFVF